MWTDERPPLPSPVPCWGWEDTRPSMQRTFLHVIDGGTQLCGRVTGDAFPKAKSQELATSFSGCSLKSHDGTPKEAGALHLRGP